MVEMFQDALIPLIEDNVVTNLQKKFLPNHTVTSFISGSQALYDYVGMLL